MHLNEGLLLFLVSKSILAAVAWLGSIIQRALTARRPVSA
jgi:hypothetical protein